MAMSKMPNALFVIKCTILLTSYLFVLENSLMNIFYYCVFIYLCGMLVKRKITGLLLK